MSDSDSTTDGKHSRSRKRLRITAWVAGTLLVLVFMVKFNMAPATEGWVIDADSGEPVEGVVVVVYWVMEKAWAWSVALAGAVAVFERVTDKDGRYRISGCGPRWRKEMMESYADPAIILLKNGYKPRIIGNMEIGGCSCNGRRAFFRPSMWDGKTVEIKRFTGTPEERVKELRLAIPALEGDHSKQIPLLLNALLAEEKNIPNSVHRKGPFFDNIVRRLLRGD